MVSYLTNQLFINGNVIAHTTKKTFLYTFEKLLSVQSNKISGIITYMATLNDEIVVETNMNDIMYDGCFGDNLQAKQNDLVSTKNKIKNEDRSVIGVGEQEIERDFEEIYTSDRNAKRNKHNRDEVSYKPDQIINNALDYLLAKQEGIVRKIEPMLFTIEEMFPKIENTMSKVIENEAVTTRKPLESYSHCYDCNMHKNSFNSCKFKERSETLKVDDENVTYLYKSNYFNDKASNLIIPLTNKNRTRFKSLQQVSTTPVLRQSKNVKKTKTKYCLFKTANKVTGFEDTVEPFRKINLDNKNVRSLPMLLTNRQNSANLSPIWNLCYQKRNVYLTHVPAVTTFPNLYSAVFSNSKKCLHTGSHMKKHVLSPNKNSANVWISKTTSFDDDIKDESNFKIQMRTTKTLCNRKTFSNSADKSISDSQVGEPENNYNLLKRKKQDNYINKDRNREFRPNINREEKCEDDNIIKLRLPSNTFTKTEKNNLQEIFSELINIEINRRVKKQNLLQCADEKNVTTFLVDLSKSLLDDFMSTNKYNTNISVANMEKEKSQILEFLYRSITDIAKSSDNTKAYQLISLSEEISDDKEEREKILEINRQVFDNLENNMKVITIIDKKEDDDKKSPSSENQLEMMQIDYDKNLNEIGDNIQINILKAIEARKRSNEEISRLETANFEEKRLIRKSTLYENLLANIRNIHEEYSENNKNMDNNTDFTDTRKNVEISDDINKIIMRNRISSSEFISNETDVTEVLSEDNSDIYENPDKIPLNFDKYVIQISENDTQQQTEVQTNTEKKQNYALDNSSKIHNILTAEKVSKVAQRKFGSVTNFNDNNAKPQENETGIIEKSKGNIMTLAQCYKSDKAVKGGETKTIPEFPISVNQAVTETKSASSNPLHREEIEDKPISDKNTEIKINNELLQNQITEVEIFDDSIENIGPIDKTADIDSTEEENTNTTLTTSEYETEQEERKPMGSNVYNKLPLHFKKSAFSALPAGSIWNQEPKIHVTPHGSKKCDKPKKYRYETKEIDSAKGKKVRITYLVEDCTN